MNDTAQLWTVVYSVLWSVPMVLLYLTGMILSIVFRQRLGKMWLLPLLAFLLHIITTVVAVIVQNALTYYLLHGGDHNTYPLLAQTTSGIALFLHIVADIMILIALFRKTENPARTQV